MSQTINKGMGFIPDVPDFRDQYFKVTKPELKLPPLVDLRQTEAMKFPIFDQGSLGSCTANCISAAIAYAYYKQQLSKMKGEFGSITNPYFIGSRLFIYYNERQMEGTITSDSGAMLRDGIKSVNRRGVCKEATWPYKVEEFACKPSPNAFTEAKLHQALQYRRIDNSRIENIKGCLAEGFPTIFGFAVYESFMSSAVAKTGVVPMPSRNEKMLGGHAVLCVGYDDSKSLFVVRNSWGIDWGDKGYFYLPYNYMTNLDLATDFWNITMMEQVNGLLR